MSELLHAENLFILGAKSIGVCEAGEIFRKKITRPHFRVLAPSVPGEVQKLIGYGAPNGEHFRRGLADKLVQNSPNPMPMLGKHSSMFVFINSGEEILL